MSRDNPTKRERAYELLRDLERGPSIADSLIEPKNGKECEERVQLWLQSWIIPRVKALIPQLQKKKPKRPTE